MKKTISSLLLLASLTSFAQSNYTAIPDFNFETKLIQLGLDSGTPDGKILTSNINTLTSLDVSLTPQQRSTGFGVIQSLEGIQDFVALKTLLCYNNILNNLNLYNNLELTYLNCSSNSIRSLDFSRNTKLEYLDCSNNFVSLLDIDSSLNLTFLNCRNNHLTDLDTGGNTLLTTLDATQNRLFAVNLKNNTLLTSLTIFFNNLSRLDLTRNVNLTYIGCGRNKLSSLDVSKNIALKSLYLAVNEVRYLDVSANTSLKDLDCLANKLISLKLNSSNSLIGFKDFKGNPDLRCIQVDNDTFASIYWSAFKDATASYSRNCSSFVAPVAPFTNVFPNPSRFGQTITIKTNDIPIRSLKLLDQNGTIININKIISPNGLEATFTILGSITPFVSGTRTYILEITKTNGTTTIMTLLVNP
jgi:Leucine-rich repeat (LRR) protein